MTQAEQGVYLFCFARASAARDIAVAGLGGSDPVSTLEAGDAAAVFCAVSLADFQGELAERNLNDPAWVVPRACEHERVIEAVMTRSPVLPARFGSVFASKDALEAFLADRHPEISKFLESVADKEEWGLKAFVDAHKAGERLLLSEPTLVKQFERLAESPGTRYFQERRLRAEVTRHAEVWSCQMAEEIQSELAADAVSVCPLPILPRSFSERPDDMVLNCAVLLASRRVADFRYRAETLSARLGQHGVTIELSGPWPPYSFCPTLEPRETVKDRGQ